MKLEGGYARRDDDASSLGAQEVAAVTGQNATDGRFPDPGAENVESARGYPPPSGI